MHEEREALQGLLEPFILGDKLAEQLVGEHVCWAKMDYQELCLKMARLTLDVKGQNEAFEKLEAEWNDIKHQFEEEPLGCS